MTPKPIRKVRRAAITVRHPASSLEGAAKASLSASYSQIAVSRVRCRWVRAHVQLQMLLQNKSRQGIKLTVSPQYTLAGHGSHGGSIDGYRDIGIPRRSTKVVFIDAGKPINTSGQPRITSCGPDLVGIDGW